MLRAGVRAGLLGWQDVEVMGTVTLAETRAGPGDGIYKEVSETVVCDSSHGKSSSWPQKLHGQ